MQSANEVLEFWFDPDNQKRWYVADPAFDAQIRQRFGDCLDAAIAGQLTHWTQTAEGWLALLIVLDQFSRNLYRNDARAWAQDAEAQRLALWGIAEGFDCALPPLQRVFAYMPLEHGETVELQRRSVELFDDLRQDAPDDQRERFDMFYDYAVRHQVVVEQFGRFPHRNAVLGRASTADELEYLAQPGAGF